MTLELLDAELKRDEGEKLCVYDDADGTPIKRGSVVKGVPTIGIGANATFLYPEESRFIYAFRRDKAIAEVRQALPWFDAASDARQRALVNLYYNVPEFLRWPHFIGFSKAGEWEKAAAELENTHPWIYQVKSRGYRIAAMLREG